MHSLKPEIISVPLQQNSYPIWIQKGIRKSIGELLKPIKNNQKWIIASPTPVLNLYGNEIFEILNQFGFKTKILEIDDGEKVKSFHHYKKYSKKLIDLGCNRDSILIALGGGVTGDLCGFIASTLFRGIPYYQIPTTLLSMVDSSIGGKTAINLKEGKNLIGTFHHPNAVIIDPEFLRSLPEKEIYSGLGEIIKYGFIKNPVIFEIFQKLNFSKLDIQSKTIEQLIILSAEVKAYIVSKDTSEKNLRKILNFGHTTGHIIEAFTKYSHISHGEAISYGMMVSLIISQKYFKLPRAEMVNSINILKKLCRTNIPYIPKEKFYKFLFKDKKIKSKKINFILINNIGKPIIRDDVTPEIIYDSYNSLLNNLF
tara:strand:+ start:102 stop:1208 length:1107 start_codon:yes stop_codon:yes gene_type:complete